MELSSEGFSVFFARLAIIDIGGGGQPFVDPVTGTIAVVNGEIYNHSELRELLEPSGYTFSSMSDGEVVLWGFLCWGDALFEKLVGMFAIAIFSPADRQLVLARDRIGKKPLYWTRSPEGIVKFGSEISTISSDRSDCLPKHLQEYLTFDAISWSGECECGVTSVPPGSIVKLSRHEVVTSNFWEFGPAMESKLSKLSRRDEFEFFFEAVEVAVKDRMMSDVPVGVFLSDGMDSKLVTTLAKKNGALEVAYCLKFDKNSYDESDGAIAFARNLSIPPQIVSADIAELEGAWHTYKPFIDEPVADSAILAEVLLAKAAMRRTKVVLSGDGGDELFMGYQHVAAHRLLEAPLLGFGVRLISPLLRFIKSKPSADEYFSPSFVLDRFLRGSTIGELVERDLAWRVSTSPSMARSLNRNYDQAIREELIDSVKARLPQIGSLNEWEYQWTSLYFETYLRDVILRKVDRATMRFGVEARSPLLDARVVEASLAMGHWARGGVISKKRPIAMALSRLGISNNKSRKHGMGVPLGDLLAGPLRAEVNRALSPERLASDGLFDPKVVQDLLAEFAFVPELRAREVWSLLVFQTWVENQQERVNVKV